MYFYLKTKVTNYSLICHLPATQVVGLLQPLQLWHLARVRPPAHCTHCTRDPPVRDRGKMRVKVRVWVKVISKIMIRVRDLGQVQG